MNFGTPFAFEYGKIDKVLRLKFMTNPIILKLMSSLLNGKASVNGKASGNVQPFKSEKGNRHFLSDMLKALHDSKNSAFNMADKPAKMGAIPSFVP